MDSHSDEEYGQKYYNDVGAGYHENYSSSSYLPTTAPAGPEKPSASTLTLAPTDDGMERRLNEPPATAPWGPSKGTRRIRLREAIYPDSLACRLYLMVVVVETFLDLCIESIILARVNNALDQTHDANTPSLTLARSRIPVYLSIFGMAHIFQFLLALDAVYYKNVLQFIFLAIFNALFFVRVLRPCLHFMLGVLKRPISLVAVCRHPNI